MFDGSVKNPAGIPETLSAHNLVMQRSPDERERVLTGGLATPEVESLHHSIRDMLLWLQANRRLLV